MDEVSQLTDQARELGIDLDEGRARSLIAYEQLLATKGAGLGLVSRADMPRIRERHLLDSLRAAALPAPAASIVYDLGSGGGLPGLPFAIARPEVRVRLVEARRSRAAFLELATDLLVLENVEVHLGRIEDLSGPVEGAVNAQPGADLCLARALASLEECWELAAPLLRPKGRLVYFAGSTSRLAELEELAGAASREIRRAPTLASSGALVIIGRP